MKTTKSLVKAQMGWVWGKISMGGQVGYFDPMGLPITLKDKEITLEELLNKLVAQEEQHKIVLQRLNGLKSSLRTYLSNAGYDLPDDTLNELINGISNVNTINPTDKHSIAILKDGFINDIIDIEIEQLLRNEKVPIDLALGYYKVEHGKIVVDIKRKEETLMTD